MFWPKRYPERHHITQQGRCQLQDSRKGIHAVVEVKHRRPNMSVM